MTRARWVIMGLLMLAGPYAARADEPTELKVEVEAKLKRALVTRRDITGAAQEYHAGERALADGNDAQAAEHFRRADQLLQVSE